MRQEQRKRQAPQAAQSLDQLLANDQPVLPRRLSFVPAKHAASRGNGKTSGQQYKPLNARLGNGQHRRASGSTSVDASGRRRIAPVPVAKAAPGQTQERRSSSSSSVAQPGNGTTRPARPALSLPAHGLSVPAPAATDLFPAERIARYLSWPDRTSDRALKQPVGCGLHNLGNTCFLNSVLQCLTHAPPLALYLRTREHSRACRKLGFCMLCELETHVRRALTSQQVFAPRSIVHNLRAIARQFRPGRQEDAHEFLRFVVDGAHNASIAGLGKVPHPVQQTSVMNRIFGGMLCSSITCSVCHRDSTTRDPFQDLSLDLARVKTIEESLQMFTKPEILDGSNRYRCEGCKKHVRASKGFMIAQAPAVLVLQLKRFSSGGGGGGFASRYYGMGGGGGKVTRHIGFPLTLDLRRFTRPRDPGAVYDLFAVNVHQGFSCHSGHYYAYVRGVDGNWYRVDDESVSRSSAKVVLAQSAYMLFYLRRPAPPGRNGTSNGTGSGDQSLSAPTPPASAPSSPDVGAAKSSSRLASSTTSVETLSAVETAAATPLPHARLGVPVALHYTPECNGPWVSSPQLGGAGRRAETPFRWRQDAPAVAATLLQQAQTEKQQRIAETEAAAKAVAAQAAATKARQHAGSSSSSDESDSSDDAVSEARGSLKRRRDQLGSSSDESDDDDEDEDDSMSEDSSDDDSDDDETAGVSADALPAWLAPATAKPPASKRARPAPGEAVLLRGKNEVSLAPDGVAARVGSGFHARTTSVMPSLVADTVYGAYVPSWTDDADVRAARSAQDRAMQAERDAAPVRGKDEWDAELDRGKVKKVRAKPEPSLGPSTAAKLNMEATYRRDQRNATRMKELQEPGLPSRRGGKKPEAPLTSRQRHKRHKAMMANKLFR